MLSLTARGYLLVSSQGGLGQAFRQVGTAAAALRAPTEAHAERLATLFRTPLKAALAHVGAAKEVIDARAEVLIRLQTSRSRAAAKRAKLEAALHGPPMGAPIAPTAPTSWLERFTPQQWSAPTTVEELQREAESSAKVWCGVMCVHACVYLYVCVYAFLKPTRESIIRTLYTFLTEYVSQVNRNSRLDQK